MKRIVVLGAGPTGLGAGYRLNEIGHEDWDMYEMNSYVGGLSASFVDDKGFHLGYRRPHHVFSLSILR